MGILGAHWIPGHNRNSDVDFINSLRGGWVLIVDPDVNHISKIYQNDNSKFFVLRNHPLSEQHAELLSDPSQTAINHILFWENCITKLYNQARERGLPMPKQENIVVLGINEPAVWNPGVVNALALYTRTMLIEATKRKIRVGAFNFSVGWPANTGKDTPVDWSPYSGIDLLIKDGNHFLSLHEYWPKDGPEYNWGWLAGRYLQCPWDVPIIITECGIDQYCVEHIENFDMRGWRAYYGGRPDLYADQIFRYAVRADADPRVLTVMPFTSDYGGAEWKSFDVEEIYPVVYNGRTWPDVQTYIPGVYTFSNPIVNTNTGGSATRPANTDVKIVLPFRGQYVVTQLFGENPDFYKPFNGHTGIDYGMPVGTEIRAVYSGTVVEADVLGDWGNYVKIQHDWGESLYAHLSRIDVQYGQSVGIGQPIGLSGNTGRSTGPHLHFGVRINPYVRTDGWDGFSDPSAMFTDDKFLYAVASPSTKIVVNVEQPDTLVQIRTKHNFTINLDFLE